MNVVYIHSHDTGRYIQPYGYAMETPHLQRFAEQGTLFRKAFCANPTCSPSRACVLTGQWAHQCGAMGLAHRGFELRDKHKHLATVLHQVGYHTVLCGIQHEARDPSTLGYDQIIDGGTKPEEARKSGIDRAKIASRWLDSAPKQPFFLSVGFFETHRVFPATDARDCPDYVAPPLPLPDIPEVREEMAAYRTSARILDDSIGIVLDSLDRNGLADDTLVICTTDHGIAFPKMKCNLTDHGIGVMLMIRAPKSSVSCGPRVVDAMVSQIDLVPTVFDLMGKAAPAWCSGKSIVPLMRGETQEVNDAIFASVNFHASYEPMRCVRTSGWKYIRRFDDRTAAVLPNCDPGISKDMLMASDWQHQSRAAESLFDLLFDPGETNNLAGSESHTKTLQMMRDRLHEWMKRTDDPLLNGELPIPAGAILNSPDQCSPSEEPAIRT